MGNDPFDMDRLIREALQRLSDEATRAQRNRVAEAQAAQEARQRQASDRAYDREFAILIDRFIKLMRQRGFPGSQRFIVYRKSWWDVTHGRKTKVRGWVVGKSVSETPTSDHGPGGGTHVVNLILTVDGRLNFEGALGEVLPHAVRLVFNPAMLAELIAYYQLHWR